MKNIVINYFGYKIIRYGDVINNVEIIIEIENEMRDVVFKQMMLLRLPFSGCACGYCRNHCYVAPFKWYGEHI